MRGYDYDDEPYFVIEQPNNGIGPFLLGLAIGAGAALLFAPRTGDETREMLRSRARDMRDSARQMVDDMSEGLQTTIADARDRVTDQVDEVRSAARRGRRQMRNAMDAGRAAAEDAREELERKLEEQRTTRRDDDPYSSNPTA